MTDDCLDPQLLAAFAERKLKRSEMPPVLAHLERCPECMDALKAAMELMEEQPQQQERRWWAAAAAVAVLVGGGFLVQRTLDSQATDRLVRLAPRSARSVEARLTGGFEYAPYRGAMRGAEDSNAERMKLVGETGELVERADDENTSEAQHAAGIGLVLVEKPEDAIARLRIAAQRSSGDATSWSDLAAAEYATALQQRRPSLYPVALAHTDQAIRLDPKLGEALFNRALILERLGLTQAAREAWDRYLLVDPSSNWANEARAHLKRIPASTGESIFKRDQPALENAAVRGDQRTVDAAVDRQRQQSRAWGEAEYLGRWGDAVQQGNDTEASRQLAIARAIGEALVRLSGESLLHDAVAVIDGAPAPRRATLAGAHATYRRARIAYSRRALAAAERDLRLAASQFRQAGSPMALVARYFAANARFDQNDAATARRELEALRDQTTYAALGAQIRWELALCTMLEDDWSASAALSRDAVETFRRLGERSNVAVMQAILGTSLVSLGRPDEGWAVRAEAFAIQSGEGRGNLVALTVGDAARMELRTGRRESAYALLALEESAHRAAGDDVQLSNALVRRAVIHEDLDAPGLAREAMTVANRIPDPSLRARAVADAQFAEGVAVAHTDAGRARNLLGQAIDHYRATGKSFYLPEALLARARASLRADRGAALQDLEEGLREIDRQRALVRGNVTGTGVVDAQRALLEELIPLRLDSGDRPGAFAAAERTHYRLAFSGEPPSLAELQKKLAGSDALVLELVVLPREVIAFAVTARDVAVSRHTIDRDRVVALAAGKHEDAARELYDLLIRPSQTAVSHTGQLIVVADAALQEVAFAALEDRVTRRRLIETMTVATAVSAGGLEPAQRTGALPSILALALPSGDGASVALPESEAELGTLASMYRSARVIDRDGASLAALASGAGADVLHLGGHTERQPGPGDAALLFRGRESGVEPVTWTRIASMKLGRPVVVLAACETLRVPPSPQAQALSLGGGFLAAGATAVIGTLTPIPDNDARDLFRTIHHELARGRSAAAAARQAQLEAISAESRDHNSAWRSVAVLTNRIEAAN
jgi:CHAT domain-containing protein/tetratricopeptide (TPR) repeat protein